MTPSERKALLRWLCVAAGAATGCQLVRLGDTTGDLLIIALWAILYGYYRTTRQVVR